MVEQIHGPVLRHFASMKRKERTHTQLTAVPGPARDAAAGRVTGQLPIAGKKRRLLRFAIQDVAAPRRSNAPIALGVNRRGIGGR
jgi:hypothetical protein